MASHSADTPLVKTAAISVREFFEQTPPGQTRTVALELVTRAHMNGGGDLIVSPIELYCQACEGFRFFEVLTTTTVLVRQPANNFVLFHCRNCTQSLKTYAIRIVAESSHLGTMYKYGEVPSFGPPTPARVIALIGPEKELFLKGRRAENQGMGIGAFAYYRRVVENQKNRIFDEMIRVAERLESPPELIADLGSAKAETQFSRAVDAIKHGIPQALLINGHNPLKLLHAALSDGLHAQSDEECLELATSIRVVLADFAERMGQLLKDHAELNAAVSKLMRPKRTNEAS